MERIEQVYQAIKQRILDLELDPTQPIDDKLLLRQVDGSLTLVQQALDRLEQEGASRQGAATLARGSRRNGLDHERDL